MKNMKNMLISIASVVLLLSSQASIASTSNLSRSSEEFSQKSAALLKKAQGPGFEVFNKSKNSITIMLYVDNMSAAKVTSTITPQNKLKYTIDVNKNVQLAIYDPKMSNLGQKPNFIYGLSAEGKTKYVTWNPAKSPSLYPQTGPLLGLLGRTESGLPLNKETNVKQNQILRITQ